MTSVHARPSFLNHESIAVARKPVRPAQAVARLSLFINGKAYHVRPLPPGTSGHFKSFRHRKFDGTEYDVEQTSHGITCDCPDFTFNREGIDPEGCKHVKALVACGLIDASREESRSESPPAPVVAPRTCSSDDAMSPTTAEYPPIPSLAPLNGQPM